MNQAKFSAANQAYRNAKRDNAPSTAQWDKTRRAALASAKQAGEAWAQ